LLWSPAALAQAWLPSAGTLGYSLSYTDVFDTKHNLPNGDTIDVGHMRMFTLGFAVAYSPTDRRWWPVCRSRVRRTTEPIRIRPKSMTARITRR